MPRISVVTPCYRAEQTLNACVESVLRSSYSDVEVLIVDDESDDDSPLVAHRLASKDNRVKLFKIPHGGACAARNHGVAQASGEFIQFLDADDLIEREKLKDSIAAFDQNRSLKCVYTDGQVLLPNGAKKPFSAGHEAIKSAAAGKPRFFTFSLNTAQPLWHRSVAEDNLWDSTLYCWQEAEFHFRALTGLNGSDTVKHVPVTGMSLERRNHAGISARYWSFNYIEGQMRAVNKIYDYARARGIDTADMAAQMRWCRGQFVVRAIVGGDERAYDLAVREYQKHWRDDRRFPVLPPFWSVRLLYLVYRRLKIAGKT